jgi:hypothetical protein
MVLLQGCATSRLTGVWSDPGYSGGPVTSVVVMGVSDKAAHRRLFENDFSMELQKLGLKAIASETIIPNIEQVSREEAKRIVRDTGSSAVIVTKTVGIDTRTETTPARVERIHRGSLNARQGSFEAIEISLPPQETQYTVVQLETALYDIATGKCLWSATSEAINPQDVETLIASIIKTVIKDMQGKGLLP